MKIGDLILLKQGLKLIRCVVIDVDATFVTLRMEYHKGIGTDIKVNINSEDIIKPNGLKVGNFDFINDNSRV